MVSNEQFSDIDYADDIAVMDENQTSLTDTLERMESGCSALGLHISWKKTKIQNICAGAGLADVVVGGSDDSDGGGSTRLHVSWEPDIVDSRITDRAATENRDRIRYHATSPSYMGSATSLAVDKVPAVHYLGSAIRFRNMDRLKIEPCSSSGFSYEVSKADPGSMLAESCPLT